MPKANDIYSWGFSFFLWCSHYTDPSAQDTGTLVMGRRIGYNSVQGTMKKYSRPRLSRTPTARRPLGLHPGRLGGLTYGFSLEPEWFEVVRVQLKLSRLPRAFSGFKMVQISDLHMGGWMNAERLQVVVDLVQAQRPDLVAITGDFYEGHGSDHPTRPLPPT